MPADFAKPIDDAVAALADTTAEAVGFANNVSTLATLLAGAANPFGSAALVDTGVAENEIPVLGAGGKLDNARLPAEVDVTRVLFDEVSGAIFQAGQRGAANGDLLWWLATWINTPDVDLVGDSGANTVQSPNIPQATGGTAGHSYTVTNPLDFAVWEIRYYPAGSSTVRTEQVYNTLGSTTWQQVSDEPSDTLEYRLTARNATGIELRSPDTGYRLLSIRGVNSGIRGTRMAKLDGIEAGAQVNVPAPPTNLTVGTRSTSSLQVRSSTGGNVVLPAATRSAAGLQSGADKTKLDGIATGAEVNVQSDWNATTGDAFIRNKPAQEVSVSRVEARSGAVQTNTNLTIAQARTTLLVLSATKVDGTWLVRFPTNTNWIVTVQNNAAMVITLYSQGGTRAYNIQVGETRLCAVNNSGVFPLDPATAWEDVTGKPRVDGLGYRYYPAATFFNARSKLIDPADAARSLVLDFDGTPGVADSRVDISLPIERAHLISNRTPRSIGVFRQGWQTGNLWVTIPSGGVWWVARAGNNISQLRPTPQTEFRENNVARSPLVINYVTS